MNTQQKIEKIREACIENDPSILDLVFGCKTNRGIFIGSNDLEDSHHFLEKDEICGNDEIFFIEDLNTDRLKIIGRDINWFDISSVLEKHGEQEYSMSLDGHILKYYSRTETGLTTFEGTGIYWKNKPLHLQEEECIDLLFDLIVNKKIK